MNELMKSGEFAKFCGITKETLRHYLDIGLLRPALTAPNGYHLFTIEQLTNIMLITALKDAGCSLAEIKEYVQAPSGDELQQVLTERIAIIGEEVEALMRSQRLLESTLTRVKLLESWLEDTTPRIEECEEEYYIETFAPFEISREEDLLFPTLEHMRFTREHGYVEEIQQSYRIAQNSFLARDYSAGFHICNRITDKVDSERLRIKPKGTYMRWLRRIKLTEDNLEASAEIIFTGEFDKIQEYMKEENLVLAGDVYEKELSLYAGDAFETFYSEISVPIARAK